MSNDLLDVLALMGTFLLYGLGLVVIILLYVWVSVAIAELYHIVMDWMDRHDR